MCRLSTIWLLIISLFLSGSVWALVENRLPIPEIRILIDTSGSMKDNDPGNLRAAALRMIAQLLPEKSKAGVWIFDSNSNELVAPRMVDDAWLERAIATSYEIHSNGSLTNISGALQDASKYWIEKDHNTERHIILLTDGIIDVSDNKLENEESRTHILETQLSALQRAGVFVHTIALSENSDQDLLEKLSVGTDGLYQKVTNAEDLQKSFLRIFDHSVVTDQVPIDSNRFIIDKSVEEVVLLIFRKDKDKPPVLKMPDGIILEKNNKLPDMSWYHDGFLDLVTIKAPAEGEWGIIGATDPDNKAIVVSNLKLVTNDIPTNLFSGETFKSEVHLEENGKIMTNERLLSLIKFTADMSIEDKKLDTFEYKNSGQHGDQKNNDNIYTIVFGPFKEVDRSQSIELETTAKSPGLERQRKQSSRIMPIPLDIKTDTNISNDAKVKVDIVIKPNLDLVQLDSVQLNLSTKDNFNRIMEYVVPKINENTWQLSLNPEDDILQYHTVISLKAKTMADRWFETSTSPMLIMIPKVTLPDPKIIEVEKTIEKIIPSDELASEKIKKLFSIKKIIAIIVIIICLNIVLGMILFLGIKLLKNKRKKEVERIYNTFNEE